MIHARTCHACLSQRLYSSNQNSGVYISKSTNPYQNLAFENWLYENKDFSTGNCLFIWRNKPTVVIGKHQNPWTECDPIYLAKNEIYLARRYSGGGAVFHDMGNINFTFFTTRKTYNRKKNLQIIVDALTSNWKRLNLVINERDDILLEDKYKISGTAAKLGRDTAYHHCSLLFKSNPQIITQYLTPTLTGISSKATQSLRATVRSISDVYPDINFDEVLNHVSNMYRRSSRISGQTSLFINAKDELLYPGINKETTKLQTFDWIFGKTPQFEITHSYESKIHGILNIIYTIKEGRFANISLKACNDSRNIEVQSIIGTHLIGKKLEYRELFDIKNKLLQSVQNKSYLEFALISCFNGLLPNTIKEQ